MPQIMLARGIVKIYDNEMRRIILIKMYQVLITVSLLMTSHNATALIIQHESQIAKFISVSDIHFDPFLGCDELPKPCVILDELRATNYKVWANVLAKYKNKTHARYQQDTNYALLESLFYNLKTISLETNPQFVLILGDFLAHNFHKKYKKFSGDKSPAGYQKFVKQTLQFLTYEINKTFPITDVYPAVGNNDSYTGNYSVVPKGTFLQDAGDIWSVLIKSKIAQESFHKNFATAGYYAVTLTKKNLRLIMLDTVLFYPKIQSEKARLFAKKQLSWLRDELLMAQRNHHAVLLAYHIPATLVTPLTTIKEFWQSSYIIEFTSIIKEFSTIIVGILPGHIHIDMFRLINPWKNVIELPVIYTPSISPVYGNNPSFKIFSYNINTLHFENIDTYFYPLKNTNAEWRKEYNRNYIY